MHGSLRAVLVSLLGCLYRNANDESNKRLTKTLFLFRSFRSATRILWLRFFLCEFIQFLRTDTDDSQYNIRNDRGNVIRTNKMKRTVHIL